MRRTRKWRKCTRVKKNHNLCHRYGDKWFQGHQCKNKQLNTILAVVEGIKEESGINPTRVIENTEELLDTEVIDKTISLISLSGIEVPNTIKLNGTTKKRVLTVLLDSESTIASWKWKLQN